MDDTHFATTLGIAPEPHQRPDQLWCHGLCAAVLCLHDHRIAFEEAWRGHVAELTAGLQECTTRVQQRERMPCREQGAVHERCRAPVVVILHEVRHAVLAGL